MAVWGSVGADGVPGMDERDLERLTISQLSREIGSKVESPVELTRLTLAHVGQVNSVLNSYITL